MFDPPLPVLKIRVYHPNVTLPSHVPPQFRDALVAFADSLQRNFALPVRANPEDQLKQPVQTLLKFFPGNVDARTEAQIQGLGVRPDIGLTVGGLLCGYVELKAPGKGARTSRFTGADKKQWEKFKALPNVLYTDASEWALYRSGELEGERVVFEGDVTEEGAKALSDDRVTALFELLLLFLNWQPLAPESSQALARTLAPLCRFLREDVLVAVKNQTSALAQLAREWRQYLFPEADDAQFADAYAQTLTYALLLARLNGEENLTTVTAASALDSGHGLLAQALRILTQPEARNEIAVPVGVLERLIRAVDPGRLTERGDPWLYFYEDFLSIYDPKLRNSYGVYYTPVRVIGLQVRLVSRLLQDKFDKPLSYADDDVVFLDPAAGTAAYPLAAIEHALDIVARRFVPGMVGAKATDSARNFYAFEILVGPYAVAHLRLTKLITDKQGTLPSDGIRVFLTDTLESPHANPPSPPLFARVLTEEHRRAQRVKNNTRVLVCMGNPPYDREQDESGATSADDRKGGWVRYGDPNVPGDRPILRDFTEPATEAGAAGHLKNLYNDYVYFWRWALWKLFENPEASGRGVVSFITASSYLRGPGFVGMRQKMREAFDELWIIDLEGDQHGARKTENVFAIQTPVAIAVGVRYDDARPDTPAEVRYAKIAGTREEKLARLQSIQGFGDIDWRVCMGGWMQPFLPQGEGDYFEWALLTDIFPWQLSGVQFKRTWPIGETTELLQQRWRALLAVPPALRGELMRETGARRAAGRYKSFIGDHLKLPPITELAHDAPSLAPERYAFRSFDLQWILPDVRLCDRPRRPLWFAHGDRQLYLTTLLTTELGLGPAAIVTSVIPDMNCFNNRACHTIPLWRDPAATEPNIPNGLLSTLSTTYGQTVSAEDLFCYVYSILAVPDYVETFSEELAISSPRIPITRNQDLFQRAVEVGRSLVRLHTFGERLQSPNDSPSQVSRAQARCIQGVPSTREGYPETFSYDFEQETLYVGMGVFRPVPNSVWQFSVSGLPVLQSWLSYRMKNGAGRSSSALDEIRPERWTARLTQDLLELLWILEQTTAAFAQLGHLLRMIASHEVFCAEDLPKPTVEDRRPPRDDDDSGFEQDEMSF